MVHLYLDDSIGEDTQAILEKGVLMTTLQAVPALTQTHKNHAPYLQKRRAIKRPSLLSRTSYKPTNENWGQDEQDQKNG